jgi:hypothetical protein
LRTGTANCLVGTPFSFRAWANSRATIPAPFDDALNGHALLVIATEDAAVVLAFVEEQETLQLHLPVEHHGPVKRSRSGSAEVLSFAGQPVRPDLPGGLSTSVERIAVHRELEFFPLTKHYSTTLVAIRSCPAQCTRGPNSGCTNCESGLCRRATVPEAHPPC